MIMIMMIIGSNAVATALLPIVVVVVMQWPAGVVNLLLPCICSVIS
jgi:hypothetical protein